MNHLQNQVSPYLLQHKNNPVDWYPWSEEALNRALNEDKPIILSIGYAACHWCHVMEHESFENQDVANLMNQHFICIKVDREERPDIDLIYMDALHAMGLQGGWPLNVFLMPDQKPFYGGTYFPKVNWTQLLNSIHKAFQEHKSELQKSADGFAANLQDTNLGLYPLKLEEMTPIIPNCIALITKGLDPVFGGTHKSPKFPIPSLSLLLESIPVKLRNLENVMQLADLQLTKMALGGIFDQVGGGFSRYSVDSEWFCPHFEKMLYDNAQMIRVYALAYQRTQLPLYREVLLQTIHFLKSELKGDNGLFYTALDADSEGIEGLFYVWTFADLNQLLPYANHQAFYEAYSISKQGNWEHGYNILFKKTVLLNSVFEKEFKILKEARSKRIRPATDTKQLLAWNALLAIGLLEAAKALYDDFMRQEALQLVDSIAHILIDANSGLYYHQASFANQPIMAFLDDLAALGLALVKSYQVTGNSDYLTKAELLFQHINKHHTKQHVFYNFHSSLNDQLIAPKFELVDSVCPSSNSMLCEFFIWVGFLNNDPQKTILAKDMLAAVLEQAQANPIYFANWLRIYSEWIENPRAIIKYNPQSVNSDLLKEIDALCIPVPGQSYALMVCIGDRCLSPCQDLDSLRVQLATI
ncbi:MAG: hypothetical protein RL567_1964 [Bacteroidota bacterium]|jgi:uncharacterized protein YyaL (SSP411 family)